MTDIVTGNQIDITAFDSGMSNNDKRKQLRGTRFADWVEDRGRDAVGYLQRASQDQEGWHDDVLRGIGTGAKWLNRKWQEGTADQEGIGDDILRSIGGGAKNTIRALDAASYYGGKAGGAIAKSVGVDPRIGGAIGNVAGEALTGFGAKKALQIGKYVKRGDAFDDLVRAAAPEGSTYRMMLDTGGGVVSPKKALEDFKKLPQKIQDIQIARKHKGNKGFLNELSKKTDFMDDYISKHGRTYTGKNQFITMPDTGDQFKYMWKDKRMSWRNWTQEVKQKLTRLNNQKPDKKSIMPIMERHVGSKYVGAATDAYVETNTKVFNEVDHAIKRHNKAIKSKKKAAGLTKAEINDKADLLSLEHIFDVNFYERLKELVPNFQARGANEMGNISALNNVLNVRTGAANKKISIHDAFINNIKSGKGFPDYNKSIGDFVEHRVDRVKDFSPTQWDEFLGQVIQREDVNVQEILIDMLKKEDRIEDLVEKTLFDIKVFDGPTK